MAMDRKDYLRVMPILGLGLCVEGFFQPAAVSTFAQTRDMNLPGLESSSAVTMFRRSSRMLLTKATVEVSASSRNKKDGKVVN